MAEYYTDDITWCSNKKCTNTRCERNQRRMKPNPGKLYSYSDLEGTVYCVKVSREDSKRR